MKTIPVRILCAALLASTCTPSIAESSWTGNINLLSHYRFRGIDQTWGRPALQGGLDWTHSDGWYGGLWASNVSPRSYPGGHVEVDVYGGYNGTLSDDWRYTVGLYAYVYPGANLHDARCPSAAFTLPCSIPTTQGFNTRELNAGVSWKWLAYKLSVSASDYFGANTNTGYSKGTRGTRYHDLSATLPIAESWSLTLHAGHTSLRARVGGFSPSYNDWRIAVNTSWGKGWSASAGVVGASNDRFYRVPIGGLSATDGATRSLNKTALAFQLGRTF